MDLKWNYFFPFVRSFDYLKFTNEKNDKIGKYCGHISYPGRIVLVTGKYAILIFHSDSSAQRKGFLLFLTAIPQGRSLQKSLQLFNEK